MFRTEYPRILLVQVHTTYTSTYTVLEATLVHAYASDHPNGLFGGVSDGGSRGPCRLRAFVLSVQVQAHNSVHAHIPFNMLVYIPMQLCETLHELIST